MQLPHPSAQCAEVPGRWLEGRVLQQARAWDSCSDVRGPSPTPWGLERAVPEQGLPVSPAWPRSQMPLLCPQPGPVCSTPRLALRGPPLATLPVQPPEEHGHPHGPSSL